MFKEVCEQFGVTKENIRRFNDPLAWFISVMTAIYVIITFMGATDQMTKAGAPPITVLGDFVLWFFLAFAIRWCAFMLAPRIAEARRIIWSEIPESNRKKKKHELYEYDEEESNEEVYETARHHMTLK